jgi:acetyltransferase-like isoleucine patch superfamily enzyme
MFFRKLLERLFRRINFLRRIEAQSPRALFLANRGSTLISKSRSKITLFGRVSFGFPLTDRTLFSTLPKTVLFLGENSSITFLGNASIAQGVSIMVGKNASVVIGDGVTIAHNTQVLCNKHISIGAGSTISWNALLIDTDNHHPLSSDGKSLRLPVVPLIIGERVGIQANVTIPRGVTIGDDAVIGAGTVLRQNIDSACIVYAEQKLRIKRGLLSGL